MGWAGQGNGAAVGYGWCGYTPWFQRALSWVALFLLLLFILLLLNLLLSLGGLFLRELLWLVRRERERAERAIVYRDVAYAVLDAAYQYEKYKIHT